MKPKKVSPRKNEVWIFKPKDSKGHGAKISYLIEPKFEMIVEKIMSKENCPFETKSDVYRWCEINGLNLLSAMDFPWTPPVTNKEIYKILQEQYYYDGMMLTLKKTDEFISDLYTQGELEREQAIQMIFKIKREIDSIEDKFWKERYQKVLHNKWGHMIEGRKAKVNLREVS